jgi:hypothetical protein
MVGIPVGDEDAVDRLWMLRRRAAKSSGQVPREHLVVSPVDQDDFSVRRLDDRAVALLDIDEIYFQHLISCEGPGQIGNFDGGSLARFDVACDGFRQDAAVRFLAEDGGADFKVGAGYFQDGHFVAPGNRSDELFPSSFFPHIRQIDIQNDCVRHRSPRRLMLTTAVGVPGRTPPCDVPHGCISVAVCPVRYWWTALLNGPY